ncbi:hypothetical protein AVEN_144183-1 [Araneus ventricosus]|uniref:Uncharacterized protein n=1 Tax=Araneus ventricosus TaxID=182803 RepID=A0A4Y2KVM7_ARAVE|nr:hypothetical protein AVEN_144183-1 [Araneus ventricosus]
MGPCDDLPAKPELLHWGTMRRARRDLVTRLCRASVNTAIKEHGVMCRLTATAFDENDPSVRTLIVRLEGSYFTFMAEWAEWETCNFGISNSPPVYANYHRVFKLTKAFGIPCSQKVDWTTRGCPA